MERSLRHRVLLAGATGIALLGAASSMDFERVLINVSPSMPVGLYVQTTAPIERGSIVTVRARDVAPGYAAKRNFTGPSDRFLKRVAATTGDVVCATGAQVTIAHIATIPRKAHDAAGARLPTWSGCVRLQAREVFLLGETDESFDGRYWGPISLERIDGVWKKL